MDVSTVAASVTRLLIAQRREPLLATTVDRRVTSLVNAPLKPSLNLATNAVKKVTFPAIAPLRVATTILVVAAVVVTPVVEEAATRNATDAAKSDTSPAIALMVRAVETSLAVVVAAVVVEDVVVVVVNMPPLEAEIKRLAIRAVV